jgi:hypothetical protein
VRADYRELPFADASFGAAVNLFTSLGYLGDLDGGAFGPDTRLVIVARR